MSSVSLWRRLHLCLDISVDARIDRVEKKITSMLQRYDRIAIMPRADGVVGVLERELSNLAPPRRYPQTTDNRQLGQCL